MIYLDYNATTPVHPEVRRKINVYLDAEYGNPSSSHAKGKAAKAAIDEARTAVASLIGASPAEILFTGSATESDNLAVIGACMAAPADRKQVLVSAIEHPAVLEPALELKRLRDALVKGLLSTGCNVTDIGEVPTPVLYYSSQYLKANGAVMITGSHNPAEYNGFKSMCGQDTLHGDSIQAVREIIESGDFENARGRETETLNANPPEGGSCRAGPRSDSIAAQAQ